MIFALVALIATAPPGSSISKASDACGLRSNYDFLRDLAFSSAGTRVADHSADLARLKRAVDATGLDVRSVSYDPATGRLECRMTLQLSLPVAARPYFGGVKSIEGPVRYWAEPQGDGGGFSILTEGLGPIAARLIEAARQFPRAPDFSTGVPLPVAASDLSPRPSARPSPLAPPKPLPKAGFDCALAGTSVERRICSSEALAEADRTMSERYFVVRSKMKGPARARLLVSQRRFLGNRTRCSDEACLVGLYMARAAELGQP